MEHNYSTSLLLTKIFRLTDPCAFGCGQIRDKLEKPIFFVTILELTCFNKGVSPETDKGTLLAYLHGLYTGSTRPVEILVHICFEPFATMKQRLRDPGGPENAKINTHCLYVSATV